MNIGLSSQQNVPLILDEYGKYPYIHYLELGYSAENIYNMYFQSYVVRFVGMPSYYTPGTQRSYEITGIPSPKIVQRRNVRKSRDNPDMQQAPHLLEESVYRGSLMVDLGLVSEVSQNRLDAYLIKQQNGLSTYSNGARPISLEQQIYFGMKRQTAILLDKIFFQALTSGMPEETLSEGIYNEYDYYSYQFIQPAGAVQKPLPLTQYVAINEDFMSTLSEKRSEGYSGLELDGQGFTLAKLMAGAEIFSRQNNDGGQIVCFAPKSCRAQLMKHPRAGDLTKEYVEPATETGRDGNTYKRPFAWMSSDIIMLDNIMIVFVPDERFPSTGGLYHWNVTHDNGVNGIIENGEEDAKVQQKQRNAIAGGLDQKYAVSYNHDKPNNIKYAYMVKLGSDNYLPEHPTIEWGIYDTDVFVSQNSPRVREGAMEALQRDNVVNGFLVKVKNYDDSMMKMLRYSVDTRLQLARLVDKNVVVIEINAGRNDSDVLNILDKGEA